MKKTGKRSRRCIAFLFSLLLCLVGFTDGSRLYAAAYSPCIAPASDRALIPVGKAVGIKLFSDGILVVDLEEGSPAAALLKKGDFLLSVNGTPIRSTEHFQELLQTCRGEAVTLGIRRGEKQKTVSLIPVEESDGRHIGAYVRDSMAGIGTLSYIDPLTGEFAALGHSINDVDTGLVMTLSGGSITDATVTAVQKGVCGAPGQLKGSFDQSCELGTLRDNNDCGVFGTMETDTLSFGTAVPVADRSEVRKGPAEILSEIDENGVQAYSVEISDIYPLSGKTRNLLITVTDKRLLEKTGGIVQGMSGSPILQDGKLIGAVTHVLVNDASKGYGIFIENMLSAEAGTDSRNIA